MANSVEIPDGQMEADSKQEKKRKKEIKRISTFTFLANFPHSPNEVIT